MSRQLQRKEPDEGNMDVVEDLVRQLEEGWRGPQGRRRGW